MSLVLIAITLSFAFFGTELSDQAATPSPAARAAFEKNWPQFLGWTRGRSSTADLPTAWDATNGVKWKAEIPLPGMSSPIVWENRIFLTGANEKRREIYCFDRETGALRWTHAAEEIAGSPKEAPKVGVDTGLAAPTMATDGARAFAVFGTGDLVAVDFSGKRLWAISLGAPKNSFGHGSSLVISEGILFVQMDQETNGVLQALDTVTGELKWKVQRSFKASWGTPLVAEVEGRRELIVAAAPAVVSYDPKTGAELWRVECLQRAEAAISPVLANGFLYAGGEGVGLVAVDVAKRSVVWREEVDTPNVCTPVVVGDLLFYGLESNGIFCRNARTGEKLWEAETAEGFYASPILCRDRIYLLDRAGTTHIFSATNKFNSIGRAKLGEESAGTLAVQGKSLFIRGTKHLFRIGS